jgi:carboxyvinyl-carboxyphosphonate phosphorylmutase
MKKTAMLRKMLDEPGIIVMPHAYDCLSARLIERAGFQLMGLTGAGISASILGFPDVGLATMTEVLNHTRNIIRSTKLPIIADCDTGYGNPINVMRTISEFEDAGVAGLFFEDQLSPKKCGHFEGKQLISKEEMIKKIEAALEARKDPDLVIMARTDGRAVTGLEDALERAQAYADAGADMIFVESPYSVDELKKIASTIKKPQMANMVEGGKTPIVSVRELESMGFKIASFSGTLQKSAIKAMQRVMEELRRTGTIEGFLENIVSLEERSDVLGLREFYELEKRFVHY